MRSDIIHLEVMIHHQTAAAVLVSDDGDRTKAVWLPKSQIAFEDEPQPGKAQIIAVPGRLAEAKGLV